jgi:signal transduction histidine kinase
MARIARFREIAGRRGGTALDVVVAGLLLALMVAELAAKALEPGENPAGPVAYVLAAAITLPYAVHRRQPLLATGVSTVAVVAYSFGHFTAFPGYAMFALLFGVSLHADRRRAVVALGAVVAALAVSLSMQPPAVVTPSTWVSTGLAVLVAWLLGENLRARQARWTALKERARQLEVEREERDRQAVAEERLRIARELHDVVAHSMSVIAVQAGMANHVIDSQPALARQALTTVETTSRAALVEMRRLLGVLRQGDEPSASLAPAPGLGKVPELVAQFGEAGLDVQVKTEGEPTGIPEGVDLSAFRIVQEGLTNVLRHGGPLAKVDIVFPGRSVLIRISDDGRLRHHRVSPGAGHGLIGMRERVSVFGGQLDAGPRPDGGFRVAATLPYGAPAHPAEPAVPDGDPARAGEATRRPGAPGAREAGG